MAHARTIVIESMARTLIVNAYADMMEEEEWTGASRRGLPKAGPGEDWMNVTPEGSAALRREALIEAAVLYGRIEQDWHAEPWVLVFHYARQKAGLSPGDDDRTDVAEAEGLYETWGHYAVMSALGHGVCWEDDHDPIRHHDGHELGIEPHIENFDVSPRDFRK